MKLASIINNFGCKAATFAVKIAVFKGKRRGIAGSVRRASPEQRKLSRLQNSSMAWPIS
jgi:hypothetical protein